MKLAANTPGELLHHRQSGLQSVALVDDTVEAGLGRHFELLLENLRLLALVTLVIGGGASCFRARQTVVIKAGFADGNHFGMSRQLPEGRPQIVGRFERVSGMPADRGENLAEALA